jgi:hypothetical protein
MHQTLRGLLVVGLALLLVSAPVLAVGTATVSTTTVLGNVDRHTITWVSSAAGAVSGNAFAVRGYLVQVRFVPDSAATQPTDLYDATLVDDHGIDVLNSAGSNLSNSTSLLVVLDPPVLLDGSHTLDLVIAAAGNAKGGVVTAWVRR